MKDKVLKNKKLFTFILVYCAFFTFYFSIITFSKYVGVISGSKSTATVAKWDVSVDTTDNASDTLELVSGNMGNTYCLKITSLSETVAKYSIVLSDLPDDLEVQLDGGVVTTPEDGMITFEDVGVINANARVRTITHYLDFFAPLDSDLEGLNEINIDVTFVQAEPENENNTCVFRGTGTQMITYSTGSEASECNIDDYFIRDTSVDHNYRFIGPNPDNYVKFMVDGNEELWRIIGIFDGKMKIIRADVVGLAMYDNNNVNDWANASLKTHLNTTYYNSIDDKNYIYSNATWYLGTATTGLNLQYNRITSYNAERDSASVHSGYAATVTAPVGLMYVSDYGFANEEHDNLDLDTTLLNNTSLAAGHNWLYKNLKEYTINNIQNNARLTIINTNGALFVGNANATNVYYRPCVYLNSNVEIYTGSGTIQKPYEIR